MHFVGYSASGQQLRVVWFAHAQLDDAAAARQRALAQYCVTCADVCRFRF